MTKVAEATGMTVDCFLDKVAQTNYQFKFNISEFPQLASHLSQYCGLKLSNDTQGNYTSVLSRHCTPAAGQIVSAIDVGIELGKNLTSPFVSCLNNTMEFLCDQLYQSSTNSSASAASLPWAGIVVGIFFGGLCFFACVLYCVLQACSGSDNSNKNDDGCCSGFALGCAAGSALGSC